MKKLNAKGFSMIELLVVLLIIGILSAVAAPLFLNNTTKAIVSEAVAGAGSIREGERTYFSQNSNYAYVTPTNSTAYFGTSGADSTYLGVLIHGNKYFSPDAYSVQAAGSTWLNSSSVSLTGTLPTTISTAPMDFVITVNGNSSKGATGVTGCGGGTNAADGAAACSNVTNFIVLMDNNGQAIYSSAGTGGPWSTF